MRWWPWKRQKVEKRASGSGFTSEIIAARESYLSGRRGLAELTGAVQGCVALWEHALAASVRHYPLLPRASMALLGRSVAQRGEFVGLIRDDRLVPAVDWDLSTRDGEPRAYRLSLPEVGGGTTTTALVAEVLHVRIGADPSAPWTGVSPLRRASLSAELLHAIESSLGEVFSQGPLGSQIVVPMPEADGASLEGLGRSFRGQRGKVVLRESVHVSAAGGPAPSTDWRPASLSPDLSRSMTAETWQAARDSICHAFGVLPGLLNPSTTGPMVREAQRHLATWVLQPIAMLIAEEATAKLGTPVTIDPNAAASGIRCRRKGEGVCWRDRSPRQRQRQAGRARSRRGGQGAQLGCLARRRGTRAAAVTRLDRPLINDRARLTDDDPRRAAALRLCQSALDAWLGLPGDASQAEHDAARARLREALGLLGAVTGRSAAAPSPYSGRRLGMAASSLAGVMHR